MIINLNDFSPSATYHLMTQSVIPRPIAWVLSANVGEAGYNLAPFSYFTAVASDPPLLMFSLAPKADGSLKDTAVNIIKNKDFTVHIANSSHIQAVQDSAEPLPYGESELSLTEQQLVAFEHTPLYRLADCSVAFACRLTQHQTIGNAPQTLIFAEITHIYIDENCASQNNKRISFDAEKMAPLCRLGLGQFADITHIRRAKKTSKQ